MSARGARGVPNGQANPTHATAVARRHPAADAFDRTDLAAAVDLGMIRAALEHATDQYARGAQPATILEVLRNRLGALLGRCRAAPGPSRPAGGLPHRRTTHRRTRRAFPWPAAMSGVRTLRGLVLGVQRVWGPGLSWAVVAAGALLGQAGLAFNHPQLIVAEQVVLAAGTPITLVWVARRLRILLGHGQPTPGGHPATHPAPGRTPPPPIPTASYTAGSIAAMVGFHARRAVGRLEAGEDPAEILGGLLVGLGRVVEGHAAAPPDPAVRHNRTIWYTQPDRRAP